MEPRVYTIAGAKGGVGKTTSSINIGASLAETGYSTVVVELDLAMANIVDFLDIDIDVTEATTLHDVLAGTASVEAATYSTESGLWVIPSGTNLRGYADTDLKRLPNVVETLRDEFDVVLLDTPAGLSEETVRPMQLSDEVILISTPRVASVRNARNTQDLAERVGVGVRGLVLTKSGTGASPGAERIASFLETELLGHVPEDEAVPHSQDSGYPVVTNAPNSGAAIAYRRITEKLVESLEEGARESEVSTPDRSRDSNRNTDDERLAEKIAAVSDSQAREPPEVESQSASDEVHLENPLADESEATDSQSDDPVTDEAESTEPQSDEPATDEAEDAEPQWDEPTTDESEDVEPQSDGPDTAEAKDAEPRSDDESDTETTVPNIDPALAAGSSPAETESRADTQQDEGDRPEPESESPETETMEVEAQQTKTSGEDASASTADLEEADDPQQATEESSDAATESEEAAADGGLGASSAPASEAADSPELNQMGDGIDTEQSSPSAKPEESQTDETPSAKPEESQTDESKSTDSGGSSRTILGRVLSLFF